ncbi:hypothetical protein [Saccharothrix australiensis]|uniref:Magnesium transporter n=1 Tax=Saccharothrix australiensis TaxID=2072 RepID=A0A495VZT3_9PSEU|nr:hypothetical protein [Saccharothrix australiensis]RKT53895.1 hypothetical protein C8E97_2481 [Saccharothrix australiensis]
MQPDRRHLLLAGTPPRPDHGFRATVTTGVEHQPDRDSFDSLGVVALLAAPYLRVLGARGDRRVVVGTVEVAVGADGDATVTLIVQAGWRERGGWHQEDERHGADALIGSLAGPAHRVTGDARSVAVTAAKAFAEASRAELARLRGIRYGLERQIADLLAQRRSAALRPLLAEIIELSIATGRARDHARDAVRNGLWIWLWDTDTYHRNRDRAGDHRTDPPDAHRTGLRDTHRAALRHCEAMETELAEEAARLHTLLTSMSTFAVAQDGEAQQRFNMVAAGAAAGLGLPALILSFYGADSFLPLDSFDRAWRALAPIAVTALVAVTLALRRMPGRATARHYVFAVGLVVTLIGVLFVAGALAPRG